MGAFGGLPQSCGIILAALSELAHQNRETSLIHTLFASHAYFIYSS